MSTNPAQMPPAIDDFSRLGVRANEARPRILRQAAARQAELLARHRHGHPGPASQEELAHLCVTLYNVLDPRRRSTATERAMLSQPEAIPPIEPRWLHPRAKEKIEPPTPRRHGFGALAYESLSTGEAVFPDPDAAPPTQWQLFLERWVIYARQRVVWGALILALLIGMLLSRQSQPVELPPPSELSAPDQVATLAPAPPEPTSAAAGTDSTASESPAAAAGTDEPVKPTPAPVPLSPKPFAPPPPLPAREPIPLATPEDATPKKSPVEDGPPKESPVEDGPPKESPVEDAPMEDAPVSPLPEGDTAPGISDEPGDVLTTLEPSADALRSPPPKPILSDELFPLNTTPPTSPLAEERPDRTQGEDPQEPEKPAEPDTPAALPPSAELTAARERLMRLLIDRPVPVTDAGRELAIDAVLDMRQQTPAGSADSLAIVELAAERLITLGRYERAAALIAELDQEFDSPPHQLTLSLTERLAGRVENLAEHRRLVNWALFRSERYLLNEDFEAASEVTRAVLPSVGKINEPALRTQLSQRRDAIVAMKRMAESARTVLQQHTLDDVSASDATHVGRYRCLMLRDWQAGLAWLAQSSDPRLAQAASREISWRGSAPRASEEAQQIADMWVDMAGRLRGRMSDSARLHGYELLKEAAADAAGLEALELNKRLAQMGKELGDLLPSDASPQDAAAAMPAGAPPAAAAPAAMGRLGMLGRLTAAGQDAGVSIQYEPGTAIDQNVVTRIFQALGKPLVPFTLEFQGIITLQKPSTVRIIAAGPDPPNGTQRVRVDRQAQQLVPGVRGDSVAVDLPAGQHHLYWQINGNQLTQAFFIVQDEQSGDRLPILVPGIANPLPSQVHINLIRNR